MAPSRKPNLPGEAGPDEPAAASGSAAVTPATAGADTTTISPTTISPTDISPAGTAAAAELPRTIEPAAELSAAEPPAAKVGRRRPKDQSESSKLKPKQSKAKTESNTKPPISDPETEQSIAADLSYSEARMALELTLAQLQASDLDVESMTGLFSRAQSYAARCETLLMQVEQEVAVWDSDNPEQAPQPYRPA